MKLNHPRGLYILFFSELWERFSYYGMRALLVLYMTKQLLYSDKQAIAVYGAYTALVYASPVIGGMVADRLLGFRKSVILGGLLMAIGHFCMAIPELPFFYAALGLIVIGNGFFKPNISSMVGSLYPQGDTRRDSGFTIFYMGINIGAFLAPLICGLVGETVGWHYGFALAGVGMLLGLTVFIRGQNLLGQVGLPPEPRKLSEDSGFLGLSRQNLVYTFSAAAVPLIAYAIFNNSLVGNTLYIVSALVITYLVYTAFQIERVARERLLVIVVLMFFHMTFWAFFEQAGSSLTLFADRNVDLHFLGFQIPASLTQSLNPMFIILFAPVFAGLWTRLQKKNMQPSIPIKFVLGIVQVGLGFGALVLGSQFAGSDGMTGFMWLVIAYFFHTTGELCISPVGLSAVTKLAPLRLVGTVMGAWFLSISFAQHVAAVIAALTGVKDAGEGTVALPPTETLMIYTNVFGGIMWVSIGVAALLLGLSPLLKRWTHGVE